MFIFDKNILNFIISECFLFFNAVAEVIACTFTSVGAMPTIIAYNTGSRRNARNHS